MRYDAIDKTRQEKTREGRIEGLNEQRSLTIYFYITIQTEYDTYSVLPKVAQGKVTQGKVTQGKVTQGKARQP